MESYQKPEWMSDPLVEGIPQEKLSFLEKMYLESNQKNSKQLLTSLMPLLQTAKEKNLIPTKEELAHIIEAIKKHSNKETCNNIDQLIKKGRLGT